jgi:hypothetical protein
VLLCEAGRQREAREQVDRNHLYLYYLAAMAIVCHALDDEPRAARLYPLLQPYADRNILVARLPLGTLGSASHYLGLPVRAIPGQNCRLQWPALGR